MNAASPASRPIVPSPEPVAGGEPQRFEPDSLAGLPPELALARLPAGRHGLPRAFVESNQRLRIVAAMLRVLPRRGYPMTTIGDVTGEAGVSRAAFYHQFSGKEECFLATYELAAKWFCEGVEGAVAGVGDWRARIRAGVSEALRLLTANPLVAHLIAVEALQAGDAAREQQEACFGRFAAALRDGYPGRPELPEDLTDLLLGVVVSLIARYVDADRVEQLPEAMTDLVERMLIPYLGGEDAGATLG
jgi:AcrR family transcriptional regulator